MSATGNAASGDFRLMHFGREVELCVIPSRGRAHARSYSFGGHCDSGVSNSIAMTMASSRPFSAG
jgi:hypothetical protein